ncbi:MAG: fused MFS/spermidine synthase [Bryobacteraceae bacterium]
MQTGKWMSMIPWVVAFAEGFATLAVEVIGIRLAIPVAGSSVILTGVMLGVVLFALSAGYWRGGTLSARWDREKTRQVLARNLLFASAFYGAISFPFEARLLDWLLGFFGLPMSIGLTAGLLFLLPVYFASQTVPMLAELTNSSGSAGEASGKVLFFSTIGSVAGGMITPVYLFPLLGVTQTSYLVCAVLAAAAISMAGGFRRLAFAAASLAAAVGVQAVMAGPADRFSFDSAYQSIRVADEANDEKRVERVMYVGGGRASGLWADTGESSFPYTLAAERILKANMTGRVLVVGAAGFSFPRDVARYGGVERIDAVDVDPAVKGIAETYFLGAKLSGKIHFLPLSARYAVRKLHRDGNRYGFAFVDAYFGKGIPDELVTTEFFKDVRALAGHTAINSIMDRAVASAFARNLLASFREAFGEVWLVDVRPEDTDTFTNYLVLNWPAEGAKRWNGSGTVYRDDRNAADRDRVSLIWGSE